MSYEIVPGRPETPRGRSSGERPVTDERPAPEVGQFRQGSEASQWVLRRYLLSAALGSSVVRTVQWLAVVIVVLAVGVWIAGVHWLAVLLGVLAVLVLILRRVLALLQRGLSGAGRLGPVEHDVSTLVRRTRRGLRAELRRVGLPAAPLLVGLRLARPGKRTETVRKFGLIDLAKIVPASRLDELRLLLDKARS